MRNIYFFIFLMSTIMATDLNDLWHSIEKNSFDYQAANVDLEQSEINNLQAYSSALPGASISPSDQTVQMNINFSPATFFALRSANNTLKYKKHSTQETQSLLMRNTLYDYLTLVNLVKQKKSLAFEKKNNKEYLQKAQAEYSEGLISKSSLALWNTRYNQSKINLINLETTIADVQNKLATQTGMDIKTISTFSNRHSLDIKPHTGLTPPHYVIATQHSQNAAHAAETATYFKAIIPDFTLALSNQNAGPNKITPSFSFSINLSPVFDGMTASQGLRTARLNALKSQRENTLKIKQINRKISLLHNKIEAAKSSYLSAIDRYKVNRSELEAGKITETVFSNSIVDVSKQRTTLIAAETDLLKNHVALLHEYGQLNPSTIQALNQCLTNTETVV